MSELSDGGGATGEESTQSGHKQYRNRGRHKRRRGKRRNQVRKVPNMSVSAIAEAAASNVEHVAKNSDHRDRGDNLVSDVERPGNNLGPTTRPARNALHRQDRNPIFRSGYQTSNASSNGAYAALDLGTNNCRLLVAVPRYKGGFRVIDGFSRIVRLGEGLAQTGRLREEAMDRAVEALKICASKLQRRPIRRMRLIATEACRQAENGTEFLHRVLEETDLDLEIVSRETEARLAAEGCGSLMDRRSKAAVMFDIGGGSSELILVRKDGNPRRRISDSIAAWTSLKMGVVTLSEKFGGKDVTPELFTEMTEHVLEELQGFEHRHVLDEYFQRGEAHLLGTSGTVTTLAGIHLNLKRYNRREVDGIWLGTQQIEQVIDRLLHMSFEERRNNPCIGPERADLVLAGCAILNGVRRVWPSPRLRVADRGLREGLLTEMMQADRNKSRSRNRYKKRSPQMQGRAGSAESNRP